MKRAVRIACLAIAMLVAGSVSASDGDCVVYYYTLAYDGDHVTLAANETALVLSTAGPSLNTPPSTSIQYKRGTNDFIPVALVVGRSDINLPLSGPGEIKVASTNWDYSVTGPAVVGLKIVRTIHKSGAH